MKLLLILLACIAATNAYGSYSYNYWCKRSFCVYPQPSSFCFKVYYNTNWCSYKYYAPVLKVYPDATCGKDGWSEKTVAEVVAEMSNCLAESLLKIQQQMDAKKVEWETSLCAKIDAYKKELESYLTKYYQYFIDCAKDDAEKTRLAGERDQKIAEYKEKLDKMKTDAVQKYIDSIAARVKTIQEYHKKLIENATKCLETRLTKINEYSVAVQTKIDKYVQNYLDCHLAILEKKVKNYKSLLDYLHGADFEPAKTQAVLDEYRALERAKIEKLVDEYKTKLNEYKTKLVSYYTCSYRCYLSNSCLRFYKKYYYKTSRSLGCWYRYKTNYCVQRYCINKFYYPYKQRKFSGLKTCDTMPVKTVPEIVDPLKAKLEEMIKTYTEKHNEWKTKWETYFAEYLKRYEECIAQRHKWIIDYMTAQFVCINNSEVLTPEQQAQIDAKKAELAEKLQKAVSEYKTKLDATLADCRAKFDKSIGEYRTKVLAMIEKIGENYQTCLTTRLAKIAEYEKKLKEQRDAEKTAMVNDMVAKKNKWLTDVYQPMYKFYNGDLTTACIVLHNSHVNQIVADCNAIINKCYDTWDEFMPKLVHHYSCCYSCRAPQVYLPGYCFGGYFKWTVKYPTACYYPYYYKSYRKYYCYRVTYRKGYYSYC